MNYIYTTGYEGESTDKFIQKLLKENIDIVIDIRQNPVSRKPGFSKKPLSLLLKNFKIGYLHIEELGTPTPLRDYLKKTNNYETFFEMYKSFVMEYKESIFDLVDLAKQYRICLLCFENNVHFCHRGVIAGLIEEFSDNSVTVEHI